MSQSGENRKGEEKKRWSGRSGEKSRRERESQAIPNQEMIDLDPRVLD